MQRVIFQHLILSQAALPCVQKSRGCAVLMSAAHLPFSSIPKLFPPRLQSSHPANGLVEPWKWCKTELEKEKPRCTSACMSFALSQPIATRRKTNPVLTLIEKQAFYLTSW